MKPSPHAEAEMSRTKWWPSDKQDLIVGLFVSHLIAGFVGAYVVAKGPTPQQIKQAQEARK